MIEGKENLSDFIQLVKEVKDCISIGKTGDYQAVKLFETSEFIEKTSQDLCLTDYKDELDKHLISLCSTSLEEVKTISDDILTGYLLLKISDDSTRNAISEFISRFGDARFSSVCNSLVEKRKVFLSLSFLADSHCKETIVTTFLLQLWTKHLQGDNSEKDKAIKLFDSMLESKKSFDILAKTSSFYKVKDWHRTIDLIIERAFLKLEPYNYNYWSWFIHSKGFFNKIVENSTDLPQKLFDFMEDSCSHSTFDPEKSLWINSEGYLSVGDIVVILHNLITLECTFNKTKNFLDEQKVGSNPQFWLDVDNNYLDYRTKSQSFLSGNRPN